MLFMHWWWTEKNSEMYGIELRILTTQILNSCTVENKQKWMKWEKKLSWTLNLAHQGETMIKYLIKIRTKHFKCPEMSAKSETCFWHRFVIELIQLISKKGVLYISIDLKHTRQYKREKLRNLSKMREQKTSGTLYMVLASTL